jgi:hypothetical protein
MKRSGSVAKQSETVAKQNQTVAKQGETVMKQSESDTNQSGSVMQPSRSAMKPSGSVAQPIGGTTKPSGSVVNRYGFRRAVRMERIKLTSVRSTWWLAIAAVVAMAATGLGVGLGYRSHTPVATQAQILNNSLAGAIAAQLLLGALGVLMVTSEYGTGMIRSTLAAVPRRGIVLAAKAAVCGVAAVTVGLVASFAGYLSGQLAIRGTAIPAASLGDGPVLRAVLMTGVYLGATALIGAGLGFVLRHSGAAIGLLFALMFVPSIAVGLFGEGAIAVGRFVPLLMLLNSVSVITPGSGLFSGWISALLMCGYAAVAILFGGVLLRHRDA